MTRVAAGQGYSQSSRMHTYQHRLSRNGIQCRTRRQHVVLSVDRGDWSQRLVVAYGDAPGAQASSDVCHSSREAMLSMGPTVPELFGGVYCRCREGCFKLGN